MATSKKAKKPVSILELKPATAEKIILYIEENIPLKPHQAMCLYKDRIPPNTANLRKLDDENGSNLEKQYSYLMLCDTENIDSYGYVLKLIRRYCLERPEIEFKEGMKKQKTAYENGWTHAHVITWFHLAKIPEQREFETNEEFKKAVTKLKAMYPEKFRPPLPSGNLLMNSRDKDIYIYQLVEKELSSANGPKSLKDALQAVWNKHSDELIRSGTKTFGGLKSAYYRGKMFK